MTEEEKKTLEELEQVETLEEKNLRFQRGCRYFIDYINHDWAMDTEWNQFKQEQMKDIKNPKQEEEIKREYFKLKINSRLDTSFFLETEQDKMEFLEICKYVGTILSLGIIFKSQSSTAKALCHLKHLLYFVFIVCFPIKAKVPIVFIFLAAYCVSLLQRKISLNSRDSMTTLMLADEEFMHVFWLLTYILLGWQLKFFVDGMFLTWAYLNTIEWFDYIIVAHPSVPIVPLFANLVQMTQDNTIAIVKAKNMVEVLLVPISCIMWMFSWCAPVLGIILVQAVRIKYLSSNFTRNALFSIDATLEHLLPETIYEMIVAPIKGFLSNLAGVKESLANEKAEREKLQKKQDEKDQAKQQKQGGHQGADESDDEPKTYEVGSDEDLNNKAKPYERQTYEVPPEDLD